MNIVLIGASNNSEKFGNKILKNLLSKGHTVLPVNPKEEFIEGMKCYSDISRIKDDFDVVNFVVPPEISLQILEKYSDILIQKKLWFQPGSSNNLVINYLEYKGYRDYITESCIMIEDIKK